VHGILLGSHYARVRVESLGQFILGAGLRPAPTLKIWANRIVQFHQIGSKGFLLGDGLNTDSFHVVS
jgi:hypothetical protein